MDREPETQVVDDAKTRRLREVKAQLRELQAGAAGLVWEYGHLLLEVERDQLWQQDGAATFTAWLEDFAELSRTSARRAMALARHFDRPALERWGREKLSATLGYLKVTDKQESTRDLDGLTFVVPGARGRFTSVPFPRATIREIVAATQALRRRKATPDPEVAGLTDRLNEALRGAAAEASVRVKRKGDRLFLDLAGVPVEKLHEVLQSLLGEPPSGS